MNKLYSNELYLKNLDKVCNCDFIEFEKLKNKSILISGASGLIGSFLIDVIMKLNIEKNLNCKIFAIGRNKKKALNRFDIYNSNSCFKFYAINIINQINISDIQNIDYVMHLASNTHPEAYASDPIGTIMTNIIGLKNMLEVSVSNNARFLFASSCEIYGENKGDVEKFGENYLGYINCNTLRAGYPESKRCGEALCQAYIEQKDQYIVIARLTRTFGPTMLMNDSKALSQFIKKAINNENIVLKSEGNQYYSYLYVADTVTGILKIMLDGLNGEAYNVSDESCDIKLKDLAQKISLKVGTKVEYDLPNELEKKGYSKATKARLDNDKLLKLGWKPCYCIDNALNNTIEILKNTVTK